MPRHLLATLLSLAVAGAADDKVRPEIRLEPISPPAQPGALGPSLVVAPDGVAWLCWVQSVPNRPREIRLSAFDAASRSWRPARTAAADQTVTANALDVPQLAVTRRGTAAMIWTDGRGGARLARSADHGATWTAPESFQPDGATVEKFALTVLADDRILAAWLDGRGLKAGGKAQQLYARLLDGPGPDTLIDPAVCECCPTTLTPFPDGGALLAFRGRTDEEVRDIRTARFRGTTWDPSRPLNNDDWRINACPVNGPRLANDRGRVAAAWFTAADNDPRVLASYSPDAGARFLQPLRLDHGAPLGRVDTVMLRDGAILVSWLEKDGSLWLRRVSPDFASDEAVQLAAASAGRVGGQPRLALIDDYAGGQTSARLLVAFARETKPSTLHTLLVTVPEGELLSFNKDCDCAPTSEQLVGLPIRGTVMAVEPGALHVRHQEIPGVLAAGTHRFVVAPEVAATKMAGREFFGRVESGPAGWRIFDVRLLSAPAR
ncbi:MAG: exo-alpha-sialidase [Verrucomicrobia bacterium]|nr:exo-alpha-sialidase [Verrucomicrobiota bacterium]